MRLPLPSRSLRRLRQTDGSLIVTAVVAAAVIMILIGGMLTFISNEYKLNVRSHKWTQALQLAEAGVDIAFSEFNNYYSTGTNGFASGRGWVVNGGSSYYRYVTGFQNPQGESIGLIWSQVNGVNTANPYIFAYGGTQLAANGPYIYRGVECRLANSARFPAAMVAKRWIDMNGNNVDTDSYDSTDSSKSTGGLYDAAKRQANGDIASNETITNTVDVTLGNANIFGNVLLSPSGSVTMGPNGTIGPTLVTADLATSVAAAQAKGWVRNDFQVDIPDVVLPTGATSWTALPGTATITSGDYKGTGLSGSRTISGNVRIYLTGNTALTGGEGITVAAGSTLVIYTDGNFDIAGNGILNSTGVPINCQIYGRNCTSVKYAGNAAFNGVIYAPKAAMEIKGGGSSGEVSGSIVADTIKMTGTTIMHYDESLRRIGPTSSFNIASWKSYRWMSGTWVADN